MTKKKPETGPHNEPSTEGGIQAGRDVIAGRDIAGRDIIGQSQPIEVEFWVQWQTQVEQKIEAQAQLSTEEKQDLKDQVGKIQTEAAKGKQADAGRLEKLINTLAVMAPDIFDVVVATIASPLAGIGLVLKKVGDRAKLDTKSG